MRICFLTKSGCCFLVKNILSRDFFFYILDYMSSFSREVYLRFTPAGSPVQITLTDQEVANIGKFNTITYKNIIIPITYYAISEVNNTFLFREDNTGSWTTITLSPGNYNSLAFANELKTKLEIAGAGDYAVSVSPTTGQMTITVSGLASTFSIAYTTGDRQREKIWGTLPDTIGATFKIENPPTNAQINSTPAVVYNSTNILPSIIVVNERNRRALLYLTTLTTWLDLFLGIGTFTRSEFAQTLLVGLSVAAVGYTTFSVSINEDGTLRIQMVPTSPYINFSIAFPENKAEIEEIWGVPYTQPGANYYIQNPPDEAQINNTSSYLSPKPIVLWGPDQILLKSRNLERIMVFRNTDVSLNNQNVVMKIPVENYQFTQQVYSSTFVRKTVQNSSFPKVVDFDITDETGNSLNLNGASCYINLIVT
jgi:hypothetical protein